MRPAPLQTAEGPVHPRPVAVDDAGEGVAEQLRGDLGGPTGAAGEEGEGAGDEGPDPGLGLAFLGRRLVDVQGGLGGQVPGQFVVGRLHGLGDAVLQGDHPAGTGGLVEDHAQELGGPAFGLAEAGHEQTAEGDQPRPGLTGGYAGGQVAAGGAAAGTDEAVALILGDDGTNLGQFPDLMPQRLGVGAAQGFATTSAGRRQARHDDLALLDGDQGPFVFARPGWPPRLRPLGRLARGGLACGCVVEGGKEELVEFLPSLASSSATRAANWRICSACQRIKATTAGGSVAKISGDNACGASMRATILDQHQHPG